MKCLSCDCVLNDFEATRKYTNTNIFVDLCNSCFFESEIKDVDIRNDLDYYEDIENEEA